MTRTCRQLLMLLAIATTVPSLTACATPSGPTPPVISAKPQATPLPAEISAIDPSASAPLLKKLSDFRSRVNGLSGEETGK